MKARPAFVLAIIGGLVGGLTLAAVEPALAQRQSAPAAEQKKQPRKQAQKPAPETATPPAGDAAASGPETKARQAYIVDFQTGTVLLDKNSEERMPPSSMSKIMTAYLVFKAIKEGRLKLDDQLPVSEKAWRIQGSKMFVDINSQVKVGDLLQGMIVQSGNDACIVLAEGLAGSEEEFAERMNVEAKRLGLNGSHFRNASGWPDPDHYVTARDLAVLARHLITDFPEYYHYYSQLTYTYGVDQAGKAITQGNRNPLLYKSLGADGLKTGHTDAAGYGLTASAIRDGRRVIMVLNGMSSIKARAEESERLLEWAYREYANYTLFRAGDKIEVADVWLGDQAVVPLTAASDLIVTLPRRARAQLKVKAVYDAPVPAPIAKGQRIGSLVADVPGRDPIELPLVAGAEVPRLGFAGRIPAAASYLIFGSGHK